MNLNEDAIRRTYRLLGHAGHFTDARAIKPNAPVNEAVVSRVLLRSEKDLVEWARRFNGQANLYIGRNPRTSSGGVCHVTALSFDIDPVYDQRVGASHELVREVMDRAGKILHRYPSGHLAFTGNGALVLFPLAHVLPYDKTFDFGYGVFNRRLAGLVDVAGRVKLDDLHDSERIIKLVGTLSVKGEQRLTAWIHTPRTGWQASSSRLVAEIQAHAKETKRDTTPKSESTDSTIADLIMGIDKDTAGISRHAALVKVTSYYRARHSSEVTWKLMEDWNQRNNPPLEEARLKKEVGDVLRRFDDGTYTSTFSLKPEHEPAKEAVEQNPNGDIAEFEQYLQDRGSKPAIDVSFGYKKLDAMCNGIPRKGLTVVGALTKAGKSLLSLNASWNNVARGKLVTYFPTEMSKQDCMMRYAAMMKDIPFQELLTGRLSADSQKKFAAFKEVYQQGGMSIIENHRPSLKDIAAALEKRVPDLLVVDYVQHCKLDSSNKTRSLEDFVMGLNELVKLANVACVLVSQPHRPGKDFKTGRPLRITIHDMADSSIIEKEAHGIVLLHFDGDEEKGARMRNIFAEVAAIRNGGELGETPILLDKTTARFYE